MILPVYVKVKANVISAGMVDVFVGLSVDEPLAENFPDSYVIIKGLMAPVIEWNGETVWNIDVGVGTHYVVVGTKYMASLLSLLPTNAFKNEITVSIAGKTVTVFEDFIDTRKFAYISFTLDKNGAISVISGGECPPGATPITPSGSSRSLGFGGNIGDTMAEVAGAMMQVMMPMMMIGVMMNMINAMMAGVMRIV